MAGSDKHGTTELISPPAAHKSPILEHYGIKEDSCEHCYTHVFLQIARFIQCGNTPKKNGISHLTDGWTSNWKLCNYYSPLHRQFLAHEKLCSSVKTIYMFETQTAKNLANVQKKAVSDWQIGKYYRQCSNAVEVVGFPPHIHCFAHCLNLAAQKAMAIPSVSRLLRRIVNFFHSISTTTHILKEKQKVR